MKKEGPDVKVKADFRDFLYSRGEYVREVETDFQYVTRCPFCGDSTHSLTTGHFYILVDTKTNYNMPYICFKCNSTGIITPNTLEAMGNTNEDLKREIAVLNKHGKHTAATYSAANAAKFMYFDRKLPEEHRYPGKISYLSNRLGKEFTREELKEMKIVTSLFDFLRLNRINEYTLNPEICKILERDYIGFLSNGNSHILFRDVTERHEHSWVKYTIEDKSKGNRVYYGLAAAVDMFSEDTITINLSEGVLDAVGVRYNVGYPSYNTFNLAVCGQMYDSIIKHMIDIGVFGSNVVLNIFADNDEKFNKKRIQVQDKSNQRNKTYKSTTTIERYQKMLTKYKPLFKEINVYYNLVNKDFGFPKSKIVTTKKRV